MFGVLSRRRGVGKLGPFIRYDPHERLPVLIAGKSSGCVAECQKLQINSFYHSAGSRFSVHTIPMFADRIIDFNRSLRLDAPLPPDVSVMNPFAESPLARRLSEAFYRKFYSDEQPRHAILGINPGRFGAALTGVPFTDFKRLEQYCGISAEGHSAHEPSSEFVYAMISAMGSVTEFYARFYINSLCPLGFVIQRANGRQVNYNYYDDPALYAAVEPFIVDSIRRQVALGCSTDRCFCMGIRNATYLTALNERHRFFDRITVLPHPRFVVQYRRREMDDYIRQYREALSRSPEG